MTGKALALLASRTRARGSRVCIGNTSTSETFGQVASILTRAVSIDCASREVRQTTRVHASWASNPRLLSLLNLWRALDNRVGFWGWTGCRSTRHKADTTEQRSKEALKHAQPRKYSGREEPLTCRRGANC